MAWALARATAGSGGSAFSRNARASSRFTCVELRSWQRMNELSSSSCPAESARISVGPSRAPQPQRKQRRLSASVQALVTRRLPATISAVADVIDSSSWYTVTSHADPRMTQSLTTRTAEEIVKQNQRCPSPTPMPTPTPSCLASTLAPAGAGAGTFAAARNTPAAQRKFDPKLLQQAFAELELPSWSVGGVRVRQHVNPLKASLVAPLAPVNWEALFDDCTLPLAVDIGCGSGRFLLVLARRSGGTRNHLGLDVRERLVDRAQVWAEKLQLCGTAHFLTANATMALEPLLATYPGPLVFVSVLCPDPHFKRRHQKRRVVQKSLVDAIVRRLTSGGEVFLQSDVKDVAWDMRAQFDAHLGGALSPSGESDGANVKRDTEGWVEQNLLGVPSEREAQVLASGGRLYRAVYKKY